jgi:hypothetical protein
MDTTLTIELKHHDQGSPPGTKGGLSFNRIALWYRVDGGEWKLSPVVSATEVVNAIIHALENPRG